MLQGKEPEHEGKTDAEAERCGCGSRLHKQHYLNGKDYQHSDLDSLAGQHQGIDREDNSHESRFPKTGFMAVKPAPRAVPFLFRHAANGRQGYGGSEIEDSNQRVCASQEKDDGAQIEALCQIDAKQGGADHRNAVLKALCG